MSEGTFDRPTNRDDNRSTEPEQEKLREAAAEFLDRATKTSDPTVRANLLAHAQKWLELAGRGSWLRRFRALVGEFNDQQMRNRR
jgi:hypothetical protein